MPPQPADLAIRLYVTGATPVRPPVPAPAPNLPLPPRPVIFRNEHIYYELRDTRGTYQEAVDPYGMNGNMYRVTSPLHPAGDTIYLHFEQNHISSIRLSTPPPAGITFFYTDNLSGCRIFVDEDPATHDPVLYHANTLQHTAGPLGWANLQTPGARNVLRAMHLNASVDRPYAGLHLAARAELTVPDYYAAAALEEQRKQGLIQRRGSPAAGAGGRTRPLFQGGCFVCGFFGVGGIEGWQFWFQTWGDVGYTRPSYPLGVVTFDWIGVHKRRTQGAEHTAGYATMTVMDSRRFYP